MAITVIAHLQAQEGKGDAVEQALTALATNSHGEDGCLLYVLHRQADDPLQFATVERWESPEALEGHFGQPYVQEVLKEAPNLLGAEPDIRTFGELPTGDSAKGAFPA